MITLHILKTFIHYLSCEIKSSFTLSKYIYYKSNGRSAQLFYHFAFFLIFTMEIIGEKVEKSSDTVEKYPVKTKYIRSIIDILS